MAASIDIKLIPRFKRSFGVARRRKTRAILIATRHTEPLASP
jgi:hypothetical protein